ncbi:phosphoadenosine phosphosulfate reductase family protein [Novosphingobium sp.]|uniref:phosphoadenosine phosphosulfate reductase domain-containing protein n=1 Tax=Novosphingobium sp. TaxID=1874826 RepID=UPI00286E0213|nr:phosphoadenosine phosphosulfate reductase family protein [Novosphingobium sp.]
MNPYLIQGPALISFSGGRTSAFMLKQILDAHAGTLPGDVHVCFANTGKEREETLRFVHECAIRWNVHVHWIEYAGGREKSLQYEEVGFNSASRDGEPFDRIIAVKGGLPNWQARWCTTFLKVLPMLQFMRDQGFTDHLEIVGLRADEPWRVAKMHGRNVDDGRSCRAPLASAGITQRDVLEFWDAQDFNLDLERGEGNCDLCFMKGAKLRASLIRAIPSLAHWWVAQERDGRFFDRRTKYAQLVRDVTASPDLFEGDSDPRDEHDAECGLWCAGEAA